MDDRFKGIPYPVKKDARGYFHSQSGTDQIKSDMFILLMTNPGERVMLPDFGAGLRDLAFEPNDASLQAKARQYVINAIKTWEPRVSVEQIRVSSEVDCDSPEAGSSLSVKILFNDPGNLQTVQELVLKVPMQGV